MCASKNIAMLMRVKYFYCDENMLLLVNLYVRILDITHSNWARAPNHWTRPSDWRQLRITWAQVTGPDCTITGQAQVIGAILVLGPAMWPKFCSLGTISKTVPISETASFS